MYNCPKDIENKEKENKMSKTENKEKRVPLITRTHVTAYHYALYAMNGGKLDPIGEETRTEKYKQSELNKLAKEHGCKQVVAEVIGEESELLGMTVEDFLAYAKPVKDGKLQ